MRIGVRGRDDRDCVVVVGLVCWVEDIDIDVMGYRDARNVSEYCFYLGGCLRDVCDDAGVLFCGFRVEKGVGVVS